MFFSDLGNGLGGMMVRPEGVEPPTYWFVASCSIQLSYGRTLRGMQPFKDIGICGTEQPHASSVGMLFPRTISFWKKRLELLHLQPSKIFRASFTLNVRQFSTK
jgi:hypothetical protein